MRRNSLARVLENGNGNPSLHAGEILEKQIEGVAAFQIVEQVLDGHASAAEHRYTALNLWIDRDESFTHGMTIIRRRNRRR